MSDTLIPVPFTVTRYRCPCCNRSRSSKKAVSEHIDRCWLNPAAKSCKTCEHYEPDASEPDVGYESTESCAVGADLSDGLPIGCPWWVRAS